MSQFSAPKITPPTNFFPGQMREAGQQLQRAGLLGHRVQTLVQGDIDDAKIVENVRKYGDSIRGMLKDKDTGYLYRPAKDIISGFEAAKAGIEDQRKAFSEAMENDYQRREFDRYSERERQRALEIVHGTYAKAAQENAITERGLKVESDIENAIRLDDDAGAWDVATDSGEAYIQAAGFDTGAAAVYRRGVLSRLYAGKVGTAIEAKAMDAARTWLEKGKTEKAFTLEQEGQLGGLIQKNQDNQDAFAAADNARRQFPDSLSEQLTSMEGLRPDVRGPAQAQAATRYRVDAADKATAKDEAVTEALNWTVSFPGKPLDPMLDQALTKSGGQLEFAARNKLRGTMVTSQRGWEVLAEAYADPVAWAATIQNPAEIRADYVHDMPASSLHELLKVWADVQKDKQKAQGEADRASRKQVTVSGSMQHIVNNVLRLGVNRVPSAYGDQADAIAAYQKDLDVRIGKAAAWLEAQVRAEVAPGAVVTLDMLEGFVNNHAEGANVPTPFGMQWFPSFMLFPADYAAPEAGILALRTTQNDLVALTPMSRQDYTLPDGTRLGDKSTADLVDMAQADENDALEFFAISTLGASHESFVAGYDPVTDEPMGEVAAPVPGVQSPIRMTAQVLNTVRQGEEYNQRVEVARLETQVVQAARRQARLDEMRRHYLDEVVGLTRTKNLLRANYGETVEAVRDWTPARIVGMAKAATLQKFGRYQQAYQFDDTVLDEAFGIISRAEAKRRRAARTAPPLHPMPPGF